MATETLPVDRGPAHLRERLLRESTNVELRQKYLATRGPELVRVDLRAARRRVIWMRHIRDSLFLGLLGALGGVVGDCWLGNAFVPGNPYAIVAKTVLGAALVMGLVFAVLGSLGHVVFAEVVGDYSEAARRKSSSLVARCLDTAVEVVGGAVWGSICGLLTCLWTGYGVLLWSLLGGRFASPEGPLLAGTFGGAMLGFTLAGFAGFLGWLRKHPVGQQHAALGPLPFWAYFLPARTARKRFLRRPAVVAPAD